MHNYFLEKHSWYKKWHDNPGHHFAHWLLLLLIILPLALAVITDIELTYSTENYMFALEHDGANDSASTTRPLTTEEQITALPNCVPDAVLTTIELPILCDFAPSKIRPGGQITAVGVNLSPTGNLSNTQGSVIPLSGSLVQKTDARGRILDYVTFTIPGSLKNGPYNLRVINGGSFAVANKVLTVSSAGIVQQTKIIRHVTFPRSIVPSLLGTTNLGELIGNIFNFSIQILGLIIFVIIVISGFQWLTAGGNAGTIGKAQSRITQALLGAVILLSSFLILKTINPDLIKGGSTLEQINVPKGEVIIIERDVNPPLPQCSPACPTGQYCVIDSAINTASCKVNPGLLGDCDPMNPNSCPSGQTCQLDVSTSTATCIYQSNNVLSLIKPWNGSDPYPTSDWGNSDPKIDPSIKSKLNELKTAFDALNQSWQQKGHSAIQMRQAYRPQSYQEHYRSIWEIYAIINNRDNTVGYLCDETSHLNPEKVKKGYSQATPNEKALLQKEFQTHSVSGPTPAGCISDHSSGIALDITPPSGQLYAELLSESQKFGLCHNISGDLPHFALYKYLPSGTECSKP